MALPAQADVYLPAGADTLQAMEVDPALALLIEAVAEGQQGRYTWGTSGHKRRQAAVAAQECVRPEQVVAAAAEYIVLQEE